MPWGLPAAVGRAVQLWWRLPWRVVVLTVKSSRGMPLQMPWAVMGCRGKPAACRGHCYGNATACHQKVKSCTSNLDTGCYVPCEALQISHLNRTLKYRLGISIWTGGDY